MAEGESRSFWGTIPGCITAMAGLVTAIGGLVAVLHQTGVIGRDRPGSPPQEARVAAPSGTTAIVDQQDLRELGGNELDRKQERLEELLRRLEGQLEEAPAADGLEDSPTVAAVAGLWQGANGHSYLIAQQGEQLTITESNPMYGLTAGGGGSISRTELRFDIRTAAGTYGVAQLRLSPDGRLLVGQYQDSVTGMAVPLHLVR